MEDMTVVQLRVVPFQVDSVSFWLHVLVGTLLQDRLLMLRQLQAEEVLYNTSIWVHCKTGIKIFHGFWSFHGLSERTCFLAVCREDLVRPGMHDSGMGIDSRMVSLKKNSIGIVMRIGTRLRELESEIARVVHHWLRPIELQLHATSPQLHALNEYRAQWSCERW